MKEFKIYYDGDDLVIRVNSLWLNEMTETFGIENQLNKLQEECGELVTIRNKYRETFNSFKLIEEVVDVVFMGIQILHKFKEDSAIWFDKKNKKIHKKLIK